jgi:hypothetical protein
MLPFHYIALRTFLWVPLQDGSKIGGYFGGSRAVQLHALRVSMPHPSYIHPHGGRVCGLHQPNMDFILLN